MLVEYLTHQEFPVVLAQQALWFINTILGDCFMIWRVFIVWEKNVILCIPFLVCEIALIGAPQDHSPRRPNTCSSFLVEFNPCSEHCGPSKQRVRLSCSSMVHCSEHPVPSDSNGRHRPDRMESLVDPDKVSSAIFAALAGQISATVPLSIMLRECWKASRDIDIRSLSPSRSRTPTDDHINLVVIKRDTHLHVDPSLPPLRTTRQNRRPPLPCS
ncbi:hypothetical protein OF83DRAFT_628939 [Amylostereum chailletii]|nr:hypothetical protein OF83DRAFT_628939 [Amylostereum chailletii]